MNPRDSSSSKAWLIGLMLLMIACALMFASPALVSADDDDSEQEQGEEEQTAEAVQGPEKQALEALEKVIKSLGSIGKLARAAQNERLIELEDQLEEIRHQWPETTSAHEALAYRSECQRRMGRSRPAREGYLAYLDQDLAADATAVALHGLGHCLQETLEWQQALERFEQVTQRFPDHALASECLYDAGYCQREMGLYEQARSTWNRLIAQYPRKSSARRARDRLFTLRAPRERMRQVVQDWDRALKAWRALPYAERKLIKGMKPLKTVLEEAGDCRCRESEMFLLKLLDDPTKEIQDIAVVPLLKVGGTDVARKILSRLQSLSLSGRRQVLDALKPRHMEKLRLKPIERWARGGNQGVSFAAIDLLGRIGNRDAARMLVEIIPEGDSPETLPQVRRRSFDRILRSLRSLRDPKALDWLHDKVLDQDRAQVLARIAVADALGRAGFKPAEPTLTGLLRHPSSQMRRAAVRALALIGTSTAVEEIAKASRFLKRDLEFQREAVRALCRLDPSGALEMLLALGNHKDVRLRTLVITALGKVAGEASLVRRIEALSDPAWQVRSAALRALAGVHDVRVVDALLDAMEREDGVLLPQVVERLIAATGSDLGPDVMNWRKYWERERDRYNPVEIARKEQEREGGHTYVRKADPGAARTPSYFGVEIVSRRIAFVVDCSGSMSQQVTVPKEGGGNETMNRLELAKSELLTAITKLRPGTFFNLVRFSGNPVNLNPKPIKLSPKSVKSAKQFVLGLQPGGGTNIYDSLAEVLQAGDVDTIFFLSDGAPSMGTFVDPERILQEILRLNQESQVTIHTIAMGFTSAFMESLAAQNRGSYIIAGR
ncbi:MAG: HEAT repeat domain-containing protein [Planctomycetota bacterium]|nr:HEAT repeat domain-containing protein [Planctomycetota bacterium]